jgi:hypothetical protein
MTEQDFKTAIKETDIFKGKAIYSKNILLKNRVPALYDYYLQAKRYGIEYLLGNPNVLRSEFNLIKEIIEKI